MSIATTSPVVIPIEASAGHDSISSGVDLIRDQLDRAGRLVPLTTGMMLYPFSLSMWPSSPINS